MLSSSSGSSSSSFQSFRRFTGNSILIFMTTSTAATYLITQAFRFYHSLEADTILKRDIAICQARLFMKDIRVEDNNDATVDHHRHHFLFKNREVIFKQIQSTYELLHEGDGNANDYASFGSLLPRPISYILSRVSRIVAFVASPFAVSSSHSSSSPVSIFSSPWHDDSAIQKLRQLGKNTLLEIERRQNHASNDNTSNNKINTATSSLLASFFQLRALILVADRHHVDVPFRMRMKKFWLEKKISWNGFCRSFKIMMDSLFSFSSCGVTGENMDIDLRLSNNKEKQSEQLMSNRTSTETLQQAQREISQLKNEITANMTQTKSKKSIIITIVYDLLTLGPLVRGVGKIFDWYSSSFLLKKWPIGLRFCLLGVFDILGHVYLRHISQLKNHQHTGAHHSPHHFSSAPSSSATPTSSSPFGELSIVFFKMTISYFLSKMSFSIDYDFAKILGKEITFALTTADLQTLEHFTTSTAASGEDSALRKSLFEPVTAMRSGHPSTSVTPKSFKTAKEIIFSDNNDSSSSNADPNYMNHVKILRQRSEKTTCCISGSLQVCVSVGFAIVDVGWILYHFCYCSSSGDRSDELISTNRKDTAILHLKGLAIAILWSLFDETYLTEFMKNAFKKPLEQVKEFAAYFSKEKSDSSKKKTTTENWKRYLPLRSNHPLLDRNISSSFDNNEDTGDPLIPSTISRIKARISLNKIANDETNNTIPTINSESTTTTKSSSPPFFKPIDSEMPQLLSLDRDEQNLLYNEENDELVQNRVFVVDLWSPFYSIQLSNEEFLSLRILGLEVVSSVLGLKRRREVLFEKLLNQTARDVLDPHSTIFLDILLLIRKSISHRIGLALFGENTTFLGNFLAVIFSSVKSFAAMDKPLSGRLKEFLGSMFSSLPSSLSWSLMNNNNIDDSSSSSIPMIPHSLFGVPSSLMTWVDCVEYYLTILDQFTDRSQIVDNYIQFEILHTHLTLLLLSSSSSEKKIDSCRISSDRNAFLSSSSSGGVKLEFTNVSLSYSNSISSSTTNLALNNLSFTINAGETIGVLGESGCGKSSILKLLLRLYDPTSGEILIINNSESTNNNNNNETPSTTNLKSIKDIRSWRRNAISYVDQQPLLSSTATIRENIEFGRVLPREVIDEALRLAHCDVFVDRLKDGMDSILGFGLSSGERQRIALARALARKDAPILLLDEATSALDAVSEGIIVENISQDNKRCSNSSTATTTKNINIVKQTKIIVAHRLSTLKHADRIMVMDKGGKLIAFDCHENLVKSCVLYQELCERQSLLKNLTPMNSPMSSKKQKDVFVDDDPRQVLQDALDKKRTSSMVDDDERVGVLRDKLSNLGLVSK